MTEADIDGGLLRDSRGLEPTQREARRTWFATLGWDQASSALFELETLLKGIVCIGGTDHNLPGDGTTPIPSMVRLRIVRLAIDRAIARVDEFLKRSDADATSRDPRTSLLPRGLEGRPILPEADRERSPEDSLRALRSALRAQRDLADEMLASEPRGDAAIRALISGTSHEIAYNAHFGSIRTLEFCAEYDEITDPAARRVLLGADDPTVRYEFALAYSGLTRIGRYAQQAAEHAEQPRTGALAYVDLAAIRSDARALGDIFLRRCGDHLAHRATESLLEVASVEVVALHAALAETLRRLARCRGLLGWIGVTLRAHVEAALLHGVGAPAGHGGPLDPAGLVETARRLPEATSLLRTHLTEHGAEILGIQIHEAAPQPRGAPSLVLVEGAWQFGLVLRAFLEKSRQAAASEDAWSASADSRFVRDFGAHAVRIGLPILRWTNYPALDAFDAAICELRGRCHHSATELRRAAKACELALAHLKGVERKDTPRTTGSRANKADRARAAERLRAYLGSAKTASNT